jgi:hypothetical protein
MQHLAKEKATCSGYDNKPKPEEGVSIDPEDDEDDCRSLDFRSLFL